MMAEKEKEVAVEQVLQENPQLIGEEDISPDVVEKLGRRATTRITRDETHILKAIFLEVGAESRSKLEMDQLLQALLLEPTFCHLKLSQLRRVFTLYKGEMDIRRGVGALFAQVTARMRTEIDSEFINYAIITSLCRMKDYADMNEYNAMPRAFYHFLSRIWSFHEMAARGVFEGSLQKARECLWAGDEGRIASFAAFACTYLLGYYEQCWRGFALMESTCSLTALSNGRPDLSLADLEMEMNMERRRWRNADHPINRIFFTSTYAEVCDPGKMSTRCAGDDGDGEVKQGKRREKMGEVRTSAALESKEDSADEDENKDEDEDGAEEGDAMDVERLSLWDNFFMPMPSDGRPAYPPMFASLAALGDYSALKAVIFAAFETSFYAVYAEHLLLQAHAHPAFVEEEEEAHNDRGAEEVVAEAVAQVHLRRHDHRADRAEVDCEEVSFEETQQEEDSGEESDVEYDVEGSAAPQTGVKPAYSPPIGAHDGSSGVSDVDAQVLYYIAGAALRASFGTLHSVCTELALSEKSTSMLIAVLLNGATHSKSAAEEDKLPTSMITQRATAAGRMMYARRAMYELVLNVEEKVLRPNLCNPFAVCVLGNDFCVYLCTKLHSYDVYDHLEYFFLSIFAECEQVEEVEEGGNVCGDSADIVYLTVAQAHYIVAQLCLKFWSYFTKVIVAEFVKQMNRTTTHNKDINKLAFRIQAMLQNVNVVPVSSSLT